MSTVHATLELIESISTAVDNKKNIALEYSLTLKKLFDTVNHDLLVRNHSSMELEVLQMHG